MTVVSQLIQTSLDDPKTANDDDDDDDDDGIDDDNNDDDAYRILLM